MSVYRTKNEEGLPIMHADDDGWSSNASQKLVYVYRKSGGKTCLWLVLGLVLVIAIVAMTLAIVSYHSSQAAIERTVVFYGGSGLYDTKITVDPAEQIERLEMPVQMEHNGRIIMGKAVVVHDFNAGYTAYRVSIGDSDGVCYVSTLNRTFVKYNPDDLSVFLSSYGDQKILRDPKYTLTCLPEKTEKIWDLNRYNSHEISKTCAGAQISFYLETCGNARRLRRGDTDVCLIDIPLWVINVKLFCADLDGIIGNLF